MIIYNGQALEAVAPVKIEDVRVSPIARNPQARQRPVRFGADFIRMGGGTRTVTITLAMLTQNTQQRRRELESVACWAQSAQESKLILPDTPDRYLECFCTEFPDMSVWKWWESRMKMVFTCFDNPYWTDIAEQSVSCGTQFSVIGSAHDGPLMRIERTLSAAASNQAYSNGTETMTFSTIPAGNLVIDLNRQTAAVGNTSIMQYYTFGSAFLLPRAGLQTITGTGSVKWRERWE
jgi:predicted phage tail component-like protein